MKPISKTLLIAGAVLQTIFAADNAPYTEDFTSFPVLVKLDGTDDMTLSRLDPSSPEIRFCVMDF